MDWRDIRYFNPKTDVMLKDPLTGQCDMDEDFMLALDNARANSFVPFIINSGFRSEQHNAEVGGKPTSSHLKGKAVDIKATGSRERFAILHGLIRAGFNRIGIAKTFIHVDADDDKAPNVVWLYD